MYFISSAESEIFRMALFSIKLNFIIMKTDELYELAEKFTEKNDCNFYANGIKVPIKFFGHDVDVESIWFDDEGFGTYFLLCHCEEFDNADIAIESLSEENKQILVDIFKAHI